jgi:hypothetical protein
MEQEPRIAERIHAVVRERVGLEEVSPKGDIAASELRGSAEQP